MTSQTPDQTLWQSYRKGDKQAFGQLVERYFRMLKHYGLKFIRDGAVVEDCIQDLFLQLWQNRAQINDTESVKHYLLKSLKNHILQYLRVKQNAPLDELDWNDSFIDDTDAETLLIQKESLSILTDRVAMQMGSLPAREREALYLRYYANLSVSEIAEVMNVNPQSVSNFLQKAINKLRNQWFVKAVLTICTFL